MQTPLQSDIAASDQSVVGSFNRRRAAGRCRGRQGYAHRANIFRHSGCRAACIKIDEFKIGDIFI